MSRFESPALVNATLVRRSLIIGAAAASLAACGKSHTIDVSTTPPLRQRRLNRGGRDLAARAAPARLGGGLINLESGESWFLNGEARFPLQSVFKMILGAAVLAEVDIGRLKLTDRITLEPQMLSPPYSPVADAWPAQGVYTLASLLTAAVGMSDNTAADVLMKRIGGPGVVTGWIQAKKLEGLRIDRYERELQVEYVGLGSFRPAWRGEIAFQKALSAVPEAERRAAMRRYLVDERDTATPRGVLVFLERLSAGELISEASTGLLLRIMTDSPTGAARLKAGLPKEATLAHKTGTARTDLGINPAINDVGIVTLGDGRRYALAAFLAGSTVDAAARDALIADFARMMMRNID